MKSDGSEILETLFSRFDRLGVSSDESGELGRKESDLFSYGPDRKGAKFIDESHIGNYI